MTAGALFGLAVCGLVLLLIVLFEYLQSRIEARERSDWERYDRHIMVEVEGAKAGLAGMSRDDCPYDERSQSIEWNYWVYGCEVAASEKKIFESGVVKFMRSFGPEDDPKNWEELPLPVSDALATGRWKPRFLRPPTTP